MKIIKETYWRLCALKGIMPVIINLANNNPNKVDAKKLKPSLLIMLELALVKILWNQQPYTYFSQKMEQRGKSIQSDFISLSYFAQLQRQLDCHLDQVDSVNLQRLILNEKIFFEHYTRAAGLSVVRTKLLLWRDDYLVSQVKSETSAAKNSQKSLFFKPCNGNQGVGVFLLAYDNGKLTIPAKKKHPKPYLGQEHIIQHSILSSFHGDSVNTLRLVTVQTPNNEISIFGCYLRCGCGGSIVDADSRSSKVVCLVHLETGKLEPKGLWLLKGVGQWVDHHPDSGKYFDCVSIPFWDNCVDLAKEAHYLFPNIGTVGWDIAITEEGPLLIEGNAGWSPTALMWLMEDFQARCLDLGIIKKAQIPK